ncbi:MAG: DNA polymerase III subunit delta [Coriobacteriaceae bacterium]|nr:DNA polymerase III subunit delta [Coriobacteriaceae bacterium]
MPQSSNSDKALLPVYLFNGSDRLRRDQLVDRLTGRIAALGDIDFNKDVFSGESTDATELIDACNTLPFASEFRFVLVKDADKLPKQVQEALVSYLEEPSKTTVLALSAEKLAKNTRLYKAVAKTDPQAVIDCTPKKARDLPAQVRGMAAEAGASIGTPAAEELVARVGESTVRLDTELQKLIATVGKGNEITREVVEENVAHTSEVKPWELTDALCNRDTHKVAATLSRMDTQSPYGLLTMCLNRLRELLIAKDLDEQGRIGELAGMLKLPDWRVRNHRRWAASFTQDELEQAVISAAELERQMKSGGDADMLFEQWILQVAQGA